MGPVTYAVMTTIIWWQVRMESGASMGCASRLIVCLVVLLLSVPLLASALAWTGPELSVDSPAGGQVVGSTDVVVNGTAANGSTVTWVEEGFGDFVDGTFDNTTVAAGAVQMDVVPVPGVFGTGARPGTDTAYIVYFGSNPPTGVTATFELFMMFERWPANNTAVFEGYNWAFGTRESTARLLFMTHNGTMRFDYHTGPGDTWLSLFAPIPSRGEWHHVACQAGVGGGKLFVDGNISSANSLDTEISDIDGMALGGYNNEDPFDTARVTVDEFRVSTVQRYAANFTPPNASFNGDGSTLVLDHLDGSAAGWSNGWMFQQLAREGTYVSSVLDALAPTVHLLRANWTSEVPPDGNASVSVRWAPDDGGLNWTDWTPVPSQGNTTLPPLARFIQYRLDLNLSGDVSPTVSRIALEYGGVVEVRASLDGESWVVANGTEAWSANLTAPGEGIVTVYVAAIDVAGNVTMSAVTLVVDLTPPSGFVQLAGGAQYTRATTVGVRVQAQDANPLTGMLVSEDPAFAGATWRPFRATFDLPLSEGDGVKTVHVKVRDIAGHESEVMTDTIHLDTTAPEGSITVEDGSGVAWQRTVAVRMDITDANDVPQVRLGELSDIDGMSWVPWSETLGLDLGDDEGLHTVVVDAMDPAGNVARFSAQVLLDLAEPSLGVELAGGEDLVTVDSVEVLLTAADANGVVSMRSGPDRDSLRTAPWMPFDPTYTLEFGAADGTVHHWVEVRDGANRTRVASDSLVVDRLPPTGSIVIGDGSEAVHDNEVTLTLVAGDATSGVAHVRVSNTATFTGAEPMGPVATLVWTLVGGDGEKTVHYEVVDEAGLVSVFSATVVLDTVPPTGSVGMASSIVGAPSVTLDLTWEGAVEMWLSEDSASDGPWVPVTDQAAFALSGGDGEKVVHVRFRGQYGLLSEVYSASVVLDTTPPDLSITGPKADSTVDSRFVTVTGTSYDANGVASVQLSVDGGEWTSLSTDGSWSSTVDLGDWGSHTITVRATDAAGHTSEASIGLKAEEKEESRVYDNTLLLLVIILLVVVLVLGYMLTQRRANPPGEGDEASKWEESED